MDNTKNSILDSIGGMVDEMFLFPGRILNRFKPTRAIERDTYEEQIDFYISQGYVDEPAKFFSLPADMPEYTVIEEQPYLQGKRQIISYPSGYETRNPHIRKYFDDFSANRTGYLVRWTHGVPGNKTVLCLHGYMLGDPLQAQRMFHVDRLFSLGVDVALFIAPFHWKRAPSSPLQRGIFLQPDNVVMTAECIGQTVYDLHSTLQILSTLGSSSTGLIGASLGGYIAALYICIADLAAFSAMMVPAFNFSQPFGPASVKLPFVVDNNLRDKIQRVWEMHSPIHLRPLISMDNTLIVASRGDRLCPFPHVLELCEKWGWPPHIFLTGGHWLVFKNIRGKAWYQFLAQMNFISTQMDRGFDSSPSQLTK
jgi:predicted alpha/beta hydrolase family esterase